MASLEDVVGVLVWRVAADVGPFVGWLVVGLGPWRSVVEGWVLPPVDDAGFEPAVRSAFAGLVDSDAGVHRVLVRSADAVG